MVAIGFAFDNFDFVIYAFQDSGMDGIVAMVENPIPITAKHLGEPGYLGMIQSSSQGTPLFDGFVGPGLGSIGPDVFEFIFENQDGINHFVHF